MIDPHEDGVIVWFIGNTSEVFDQMHFPSRENAERALRRNGFARLSEDLEARYYLTPPEPPFRRRQHPNGPIYSSGRSWKPVPASSGDLASAAPPN